MNKFTIRDIAEIGVFVGVAVVLNLPVFKIHITADSGSISFVFIPLLIIALRHSWWLTFIASSLVFGMIACLIGGHGMITYPLDYLLAYSGITIVSLCRKKIMSDTKLSYVYLIVSVLLATFIRYISATISGVIIYNQSWLFSLTYNAIYIFVTGAIGLVTMIILLKPFKIINQRYPNNI